MAPSFYGTWKDKISRSSSTNKSSSSASGPENPLRRAVRPPRNNNSHSTPADPPPAYSAMAPVAHSTPTSYASSRPATTANSTDSNPYAFLASFDTIFLIDDSLSMSSRGRWREAELALRAITPICTSHDSDGVDIYFLNHRPIASLQPRPDGKVDGGYYGIKSASAVGDIFSMARPSGATPTGQRLRQILKPYMASLERAGDPDDVKPINIIVITDGRATDEPEEVLVNAAARLDRIDAAPSQVGVQFFQIGDDPDAAEGLRYLDDDLKRRGVRDMVDTCTWNDAKSSRRGRGSLTSDVILKVVLGAVLRRLDNQPSRS